MEQYKDNPNPPRIHFIRKGGRVIPIVSGHSNGVKKRVAAGIVEDQLTGMSDAVKNAEKGQRHFSGYGTDHRVVGTKSTFPAFYSGLGVKSKKDFESLFNKPSVRQDRLINTAVEDIKKDKDYGMHLGNRSKEFKVATREVFDNTNVAFRKINGRVVPMKIHGVKNKFSKAQTVSDWDFSL